MTSVRTGLAVLPLVTFLLTLFAVRPVAPVPGLIRLAAARAAVTTGAFGVGSVEILSAARWLGTAGLLGAWAVALAASGAAAWVRLRRDGGKPSIPRAEGWTGAEKVITAAVLALVGAELVLAVASPPNTYDSQTYHLPRVEHWARAGSIEFFPTGIHRQITYPPGSEYLLLHLRLLTGSDAAYNLLQWSAGVLCLVLVTRIAAQLGVPRRGQLLAALVVASVPMVVLQASSTQTDLVVAAWAACVATLVLDGVGHAPLQRPGLATILLIGAGTGLVAVTKATGGLLVGPLLVWWTVAQARRVPLRAAWSAALIVGVAAMLAGPQLVRVYETFGNPLGPPDLGRTLALERRDPASVVVNALRVIHTATEVPAPPVNRWTADRVADVAHLFGRDPNDPRTTFRGQTFPAETWYPHEDKAALPLHALLILLGAVAAAVRGARRGGDRRLPVFVGVLAVALLAYVTVFRWQPWGNRLLLFVVVPGGALAGAWLHDVLDRAASRALVARRAVRYAVVCTVAVAALAGTLAVAYGYPRRLLGGDSALTRDDLDARFAVRPAWLPSYEHAAAEVNASGARRVGVVNTHDAWDYPWYYLLKAPDLRSLQSSAPATLRPAVAADVDAIVCAAPAWFCYPFVPVTWTFKQDGPVAWAIPPTT